MASLAPKPPPDELEIPEYSSGRILSLDQLEAVALRQVVEHWHRLKGARKFPSRADLAPRDFGKLLRHVMLLRVLDGDYEYRIVGDVQIQAYGENYQGTRLSDLARRRPKFAQGLKIFYDGARTGRAPFGYRGWIGRDMPDTRYSYHEIVFLPLGPSDDAVDHILIAGVYVLRGQPTE
ncbi:MAG TPA: PAS domain-containing protein [Rhizomicrobium sp.]|nr:PAS domain-containing protein [Rhizomicrobium sp.]